MGMCVLSPSVPHILLGDLTNALGALAHDLGSVGKKCTLHCLHVIVSHSPGRKQTNRGNTMAFEAHGVNWKMMTFFEFLTCVL